jgi:hypothetical protein
MSYTYLREQGGESSAESFADIPQYALSKLNLIAEKFSYNDNETGSCQGSQSGMMSAHSTEHLGGGKLTLCAEDSRVRTLAVPEEELESPENEAVFGRKWLASLEKSGQGLHLWKTRQFSLLGDLEPFSETWPKWGMMQDGECWELIPSAWPISESGSGFLPTPTKHNSKEGAYPSEYLRNTPTLATHAGGRINPEWTEWLMDWPTKWTDLQPLEMDKFLRWLRSHGIL